MSIQSYHDCLVELGFKPRRQGVWASVGAASGEYGWKIHLSSVQHEASRLLEVVAPVLSRNACAFKVAADSEILGMLNEGALGPTQVGKFATVYPATPSLSVKLSRELVEATPGFVGPRIVTDLSLGGIVYARYGGYNPELVRDRLGMFGPPAGHNPGDYMVPFVPPADVENPFASCVPETSARPHGPAPIGPGYLIVRPLQVHAKGSVFLAIDVRQQESVDLVVLKEGRRHCMSDMDGRDIWDRLRNQANVHRVVAGNVPIPRAGVLFEHAGNLYLPLTYIDGHDFGARPTTPFGALLPEEQSVLYRHFSNIVSAVRALHAEGYVHRDLSMRNLRITPGGHVFLLDLELSHRVGDTTCAPFSQGTPGFVSPQQLAGDPPAYTDDVYALGAVMICGLTGCDPQRVLYARHVDRTSQLRALAGAPLAICELAAACVSEVPSDRPALPAVQDVLEDLAVLTC